MGGTRLPLTLRITEDWHGNPQDLAQIARAAYGHYVAEMGQEPAPMKADYAAHLADDTVLVALNDQDQPIGFAIMLQKPDGLWLENIAVMPDAAGQGFGTEILRAVEDWAHRQGAADIKLYTNIVMRWNIDWYLRQGYHDYDRRHEDGYDRVFFKKDLANV